MSSSHSSFSVSCVGLQDDDDGSDDSLNDNDTLGMSYANHQRSIELAAQSTTSGVYNTTREDSVYKHFSLYGLWSLLVFSWMVPLLQLGSQRPLVQSDLNQLEQPDTAKRLKSAMHMIYFWHIC